MHVFSQRPASNSGYRIANRVIQAAELRRTLSQLHTADVRAIVMIDGDPSLDFQPMAATVGVAKVAGFQAVGLLPRSLHHD